MANTDRVDVEFWQEHFTALGHTKQGERGLLPFRVWQFFDEMEAAARAKDVARYVCAAGLLAHYVGDACQPLHGSFLADGLPDGTGKGVHSAYETAMVDNNTEELLHKIRTALADRTVAKPGQVRSGKGAAIATLKLMDRTAGRIDPEKLVLAYARTQAGVTTRHPTKGKAVTDKLWDEFGEATALMHGRRRTDPGDDLAGGVERGQGRRHRAVLAEGDRHREAAGALRGRHVRGVPRPRPHRGRAQALAAGPGLLRRWVPAAPRPSGWWRSSARPGAARS